jgi:Protein of unknown function (DUF3892)
MATYRVTCINKPGGHANPHTRIRMLGGQDWAKKTEDAVIKEINGGVNRYYVMNGQYSAWLVVDYHNGNAYLKTHPDGTHIDNLLFLGECA